MDFESMSMYYVGLVYLSIVSLFDVLDIGNDACESRGMSQYVTIVVFERGLSYIAR